jgi:signal transduction histidine kinase
MIQTSPEKARRELYDIMRQDVEVEAKAARALELGQAYLKVENGHLTRIDPTAKYWKAIESTDPLDGTFPVGLTIDLEQTYCRRTIRQADPIALHDAPTQGWADDRAFETHQLHTYHGVAMEVDDEVYGTLCFVSEAPRADPFTEDESMFAELIARLLEHATERALYEDILAEHTEMVKVLCRVLRHNLSNDLNVIRGYADRMQGQSPADAQVTLTTIFNTIDELTDMSDKAQQLGKLAAESFDRHELDVEGLIRRVVGDIENAFPDASVSIEGVPDSEIRAAPQLESAVRELLENTAKHTEDDPSVTVSLSRTQEAMEIQVTDNGPGIPEQERAILQGGEATSLSHGDGLGLWLVYWIVTRHDGSIETAVSETGTTVTVTLPHGSPTVLATADPSRDLDGDKSINQ